MRRQPGTDARRATAVGLLVNLIVTMPCGCAAWDRANCPPTHQRATRGGCDWQGARRRQICVLDNLGNEDRGLLRGS